MSLAVKAILLYACSLTVMSIATISPSLPRIAEAFHRVPNVEFLTKMLLGIPALCIALGAPLAGVMVDNGHRKALLAGSLALYALAGTSGLYLSTLPQLLAARIVLGLAIAGIMTAAQTLIADYFEGEERNRMMGLQGAFTALGGVVFIAMAGFVADAWGWRAPFWLYAASLPLLPAVLVVLREPPQDRKQDYNTGIAPVRYATARTMPEWGVIGLICMTTFIGMAAYYTLPTQLPFYLQALGTTESAKAGVALASANLVGGVASLLMPVLKHRLDFRWLCVIAFCSCAVGFGALSLARTYVVIVGCVLLSGFAVGLLMPTMKLWTMNTASLAVRGKALGAMTAAMFLGQFCSPIMAQPLAQHHQGIALLYGIVGVVAFALTCGFAATAVFQELFQE